MPKDIWSSSLLVRGFNYLGFLIRESALVKWYAGSDNYTNLHWFRHSLTYRVLSLAGKPAGAVITWTGQFLHLLIDPSTTKATLSNLKEDWRRRPLPLLGLFGISMVLLNTIGRFVLGQPPGMKGLAIRGLFIILGLLMLRINISWSRLTENSLVVKYLRKLVVEP